MKSNHSAETLEIRALRAFRLDEKIIARKDAKDTKKKITWRALRLDEKIIARKDAKGREIYI